MKFSLKRSMIALMLTIGSTVQANTTITIASFPDLDRSAKVAIPLWKKKYPKIDIKVVSLSYADHHNAMTTALATGANLPDVMAVDMGFIGKFAESGGLEDLSKAPYNGLQLKDKLARFSIPLAMSGTGALSAMPTDIGPGALFYRKDLLDKAGVSEEDLTKSWESFIEVGKKIKASTGAYMLASANDIKDIYIRAGLQDGEGIYFDKTGKVLVNSPRFEKAFQLAKQARAAGIDSKVNAWSNEWSESFKRNKIAAQMMGAWLAGHLHNWLAPDQKGKWRSAVLPGGVYASWGGSFYAIPKKAKNKALAWEFIKLMTTDKEQQLSAFRTVDAFPALLEAQTDPFIDQPIDYLGGQKARRQWLETARRIPAVDVDKFDPVANEIVNTELEKVLEQGKDIKTALTDAKNLIERRVRR
ncbi:extracellular solute-binding protein [Chitinivorax sp. B]|uniref:ABC transporter substrate-binding protein n=1 Tax=Chitinivorax sp. B TaxID=2502235 RepID=UPI0010F6F685|nr:extracellular solute-binding protein [Chitinivorax sp. B]